MTPIGQAAKFYGEDWWFTLMRYLGQHYVYSSPTAFCLLKQEDHETWWVEYAAGDVKELLCHLPFWLTFISYNVKGSYKCHPTARLVNLILGHDSLKDGSADSVPRRGRWRSACERTQATVTDNGG